MTLRLGSATVLDLVSFASLMGFWLTLLVHEMIFVIVIVPGNARHLSGFVSRNSAIFGASFNFFEA